MATRLNLTQLFEASTDREREVLCTLQDISHILVRRFGVRFETAFEASADLYAFMLGEIEGEWA